MIPIELQNDFIDITESEKVIPDIRYASSNNFVGRVLYSPGVRLYLHKVAYQKWLTAVQLLTKYKPEWNFLVFDALRPESIQIQLWDHVKGTSQEKYVADPKRGSNHSYGFAIDLSFCDEKGLEVDMGTEFDSFEFKAEPQNEDLCFARNELTQIQIENRHLLRRVMTEAGFYQLSTEWWHYDALKRDEIRPHYTLIK